MTPDQLAVVHRILVMSPDELVEFRRNFNLYLQAVDTLRRAVGRQTNAECLVKIEKIHDQIAAA